MRPLFAGGYMRGGQGGCAFLLRAFVLFAAALIALTIAAGPASAAGVPSHHFDGTIDAGEDPVLPYGPCTVHDLAVDAEENIYVLCGGNDSPSNGASGTVLKKFDKDGNPVDFTSNQPGIAGNTIFENPDPRGDERFDYGRTFQNKGKLAVSTAGPNKGYIYINTTSTLTVLAPSGKFIGKAQVAGAFGVEGAATDAEGYVYYNSGFRIDKREAALHTVAQLFDAKSNAEFSNHPADTDMAFDSTGAVWGIGSAGPEFGNNSIVRWEADQFGPNEEESTFALGTHKMAQISKLVEQPLRQFGSSDELQGVSLDVERSNDSLFVETYGYFGQQRILQFSRGSEEELSHQIAAPIGAAGQVGPENFEVVPAEGVAVGSNGTIFVAKGPHEISKFTAAGPLPTVRDHQVALADVGHTDVTVRAEVELSGGGPITECEVVYGTSREYGESVPCSPDPSGSNFTQDTAVSADLTGLTTGTEYHYAVIAKNAEGTAYGIDRTFAPAAVLGVQTEPATDITDSTATFHGSLDADGMPTTYHFAYGLAGDLTDTTDESAPIEGGVQQVATPVANLGTGKKYQYRLVATNALGTTLGPVQTFSVAGPPTISGVHASNVQSREADLGGQINPGGYPTSYQFEYGTSTGYGSVVPATEGDAGEATENGVVSEHVSGLEPGRVYHFRLVATNKWGTSVSDDTTFNFLPEPCPNEHVRQQMKSSFLPDCRAYELVSPGDAGAAQIYPGNEAYVQGTVGFPNFKGIATAREIQNTGLANSPSRFAFYAGLGSIGDLNPPNVFLDLYTATRTDTGWETTFSGINGTEAGLTGRKVCSVSLDQCLDHVLYDPFTEGEVPKNWGYTFDVDGKRTGIVPSNVESVEHGEEFIGDLRPSPDFSHLAFSSANAVFAEGGQTAIPGSAYDNDLQTGSVQLISLLSNGDPIPGGGEKAGEFMTFPPTGISTDGSHIVMETAAPNGLNRLYMRVNDAATYEIGLPEGANPGEGAGVKFIGMTRNGSKVLFMTTEPLLPEDEDTGADVYMWEENGGHPTLTLVSQGDGQGTDDGCSPSWTTGCSVQLLATEDGDRTGFKPTSVAKPRYGRITVGGTDSKLASESGGVFFFSPDKLAGTAPKNGKNLYLANDGDVHYVATIGSSQTIDRIQISPNGMHAGLLTRAQLTGYDNDGFEEMYSYDAETDKLACVSCMPDGSKPTADVEASQNGPFMSDDGRLFFSTPDALVPADSDPYHIPDVYEYAGGRPQLISSGTSSNGKAPGGAGTFISETLGLESVSSNGNDVFFSTTDTLVPQDHNGNYVKIYDARTNGGFEVAGEPAPCVAADECHGAGAATPAPMQLGTGSSTTGGNVPASKPHKKSQKHKKHKKHTRKGHKAKKHKKNGKKSRKGAKHRAQRANGGAR
jgi:hypothetical protein